MRIVSSVPNVPSVPQIMKLMEFCLVAFLLWKVLFGSLFFRSAVTNKFDFYFPEFLWMAKENYLFYWFSKVSDGFNAIKVFFPKV